jgi:nucleotide-binding universal stress UspA family protein
MTRLNFEEADMIRSILVPLDGSDFAEHALPLAATLARQAGAVLHLAHAHAALPEVWMGVTIPDAYDLHQRQDEQAYLAGVACRLTQKAPWRWKPPCSTAMSSPR